MARRQREVRRKRWGVELWTKFDAKWTGPLGTGWHIAIPDCVDYWPMSWRTRNEARRQAKAMTSKSARHSPDWRFRVIPLTIIVRAGGR